MSSKFQCFLSYLEEFTTLKEKLKDVVDSYTFLEISEKNESELNLKITQNFEQSKVIIINHYEEQEEGKDDLNQSKQPEQESPTKVDDGSSTSTMVSSSSILSSSLWKTEICDGS